MAELPVGAILMKQVVAVIDDRTSVVCLHAAGQIQPVGETFKTLNGEYLSPPFHVHCRSKVVPWMPGFVNAQRKLANDELRKRPPSQRRLADGRERRKIPDELNVEKPVADPVLAEDAALNALPDPRALTPEEEELARGYQLNSAALNDFLRKWQNGAGRVPPGYRHSVELFEQQTALLDELIRASTVDQKLIVWRGMRIPREFRLDDMTGLEMSDSAFVSTSTSRDVAMEFVDASRRGYALMEMEVEPGIGALRVQGLPNPLAEYEAEKEILLERDLVFRVVADTVQEIGGEEVRVLKVKVSRS